MSNQPATIGGKYAVVKRLGKGGMGTVFEAIADDSGQRVAVKVIAADLAEDATLITRFQREVRTASALDTPHIVKVLDAGVDPITQLPFMAMEYLEGEDLRQLLKRLGPLPADLALRITAQACKALQAAHNAKILHRDIKPANLYLAKQDGMRIVKLLDFGVAKVQKGEMNGDAELTGLTRTGSMIGSPLYMSPEQAKGYRNIDGRSDLWSLGVVLYQMLCGRTPHAKIDELGELLVRICTEPPPPIQRRAPWVPPSVAGLLHHALAMSPDDRFSDADELLDAVGMLLLNGDSISEEQLRPLSESERSIVAEATASGRTQHVLLPSVSTELAASGSNPTRSAPAVFPLPAYSGPGTIADPTTQAGDSHPSLSHPNVAGLQGQFSTLTNGGTSSLVTGSSQVQPPNKGLRIAVAGLLAGAVAAGVYFGLARPQQSNGQTPSGAGQTAADNKPRTVKVFVLPKGAKVEVEGQTVGLADDLLEIKGPLGSVHKVKVTVGEKSKTVEVAITDNGPVPAKIEVEMPIPTPSADASVTASATATAAPSVASPGTGRTKPLPTTTAAPVPTPTTSQTGRTLRDDR
ncbi:MAG: serine/threonine protein kinase [Polyangiaceae bacterium]|nr:serine/threonine protein kinase [Polyangiaceae bacterium]